ncbi:MAG: hypothetical protein JHC96_09620 [Brevundimonas sp.]|uniref:hypothetical protein n=1 Tax=Brevundimonas sp. TaxID=1871086 RepID=UPI001A20CF72|nr:hypothetical protein [Brevundimonas sp.]MBJ7319044.1 hypothetical protein [Brevundimonas sp.]
MAVAAGWGKVAISHRRKAATTLLMIGDKNTSMLTPLRVMVSRFGFVSVLLLTLAFSVPAFETHACAVQPASVEAASLADAAGDRQCPDCGPACANGCCHAPHSAVSNDMATPRFIAVFGQPHAWSDSVASPLGRPDGPERPPRI